MPDDGAAERQALLTVLTTEHFTLQGARGSTVSESTGRAALFVGAVSSGLVALGFVGRDPSNASTFDVFVLVVLPTLYALGLFTFVRLVLSSIEDLLYGRAINRIRQFYVDLAGEEGRRYILLGAHDDPLGVLANMGIDRPSRWQLLFTLATMVAVLNSVLAGCTAGFIAGLLGAPLAVDAVVGGIAFAASWLMHSRWQAAIHRRAAAQRHVLSPSSDAG